MKPFPRQAHSAVWDVNYACPYCWYKLGKMCFGEDAMENQYVHKNNVNRYYCGFTPQMFNVMIVFELIS